MARSRAGGHMSAPTPGHFDGPRAVLGRWEEDLRPGQVARFRSQFLRENRPSSRPLAAASELHACRALSFGTSVATSHLDRSFRVVNCVRGAAVGDATHSPVAKGADNEGRDRNRWVEVGQQCRSVRRETAVSESRRSVALLRAAQRSTFRHSRPSRRMLLAPPQTPLPMMCSKLPCVICVPRCKQ